MVNGWLKLICRPIAAFIWLTLLSNLFGAAAASNSGNTLAAAIGDGKTANPDSGWPDYKEGDTAKEDIITPVPLVVIDPEATETLKRKEASRVPVICRYYTNAAAEAERELLSAIAATRSNFLQNVAAAFNRMAEGLERGRELERERQRLESELALARRIQSRLLPERAPEVRGAEIAGFSEPAREVGGDYYDHIVLADGRVALVIADVSGKGMPAALLMSAFRAALLTQLDGGAEPGAAFGHVNRFLHRSIEPGRFVTAFLAVLDPQSERIDYCNAGHNPPYLVTRDGRTTTLETGGLLLGMLEDSSYAQGVAELAPGNMLVLFTDGVTEAQRADGAMWGEERLVSTLREGACEPCAALVRRIVDAVRAFEGEEGPSDDITLLIARRTAG